MGSLWVTAVVAAFVLLLLMIFVLQNNQAVEVSFLGAHWTLPMGVSLLLAAVVGVLLVALPGTARIVQLRMLGRRRQPAPAARDETRVPPTTGPDHSPAVSQQPPRR